eukprot:COSAG01_NODE_4806_length_4731_cov_3.828368_5_plen_54_part_00
MEGARAEAEGARAEAAEEARRAHSRYERAEAQAVAHAEQRRQGLEVRIDSRGY